MLGAIAGFTKLISDTILFILSLGIATFFIASIWKLYTIKGYPGWYMFIPVYNLYIMSEIADVPFLALFLLIVPILRWIIAFFFIYSIARAYGKGLLFTIGLIILPVIFVPLLAFWEP